jgi:hypothetical protein
MPAKTIGRPVLHLHIPKTGGQTFGQRVAKLIPPSESWYDRGDITGENYQAVLDGAINNGLSFVSAHVSGSVFADENRFDFLALVRNPADQIISNLAHISREPLHPLYLITQRLSPIEVIEAAPIWFFNMQSRYLVTAFTARSGTDLVLDDDRWMLSNLTSAIDRLEWLAPTENLDEFCQIFAAEAGLPLPKVMVSRNKNPDPASDRWVVTRQWLLENAYRYAIDLALYSEADRRFNEHRSRYWDSATLGVKRFTDQSQRALTMHSSDRGTIKLGTGWAFRDFSDDGMPVYQAGPATDSYIELSDTVGRYLTFEIVFVAGITFEEIEFIDAASGSRLPAMLVARHDKRRVFVELPQGPLNLSMLVRSARAIPLCVYDNDWVDSRTPVPFAANRWSIVDVIA